MQPCWGVGEVVLKERIIAGKTWVQAETGTSYKVRMTNISDRRLSFYIHVDGKASSAGGKGRLLMLSTLPLMLSSRSFQ